LTNFWRPERESNPRDRGFADPRVSTSPSGRRLYFTISHAKWPSFAYHANGKLVYHANGKLCFTYVTLGQKMKTVRTVLVVIIALIAVGTAIYFLSGYFRQKPGGILIITSPVSNVYINNVLVGKSPYTSTYQAGQITLKLVPDTLDSSLIPYETKITLVPGVQTVVRREFGKSEDLSSGDVISFDKIGTRETGLIVVSTPENAQVSVDGLPQGFAPYKTSGISPASHQVTVKAPGYTDRVMTLKTQVGYRLSLYVKLAKATEPQPTATPTPVTKTFVQILSTPTGFLRVRTAPGTAGEEIAQVKPGSQYLFISDDVSTGWVEIQYEAAAPGLPNGISGWVSGQYVKKITQTVEATGSATLK
jgi:uncharacterized protein YgiM (DUF1202 family)